LSDGVEYTAGPLETDGPPPTWAERGVDYDIVGPGNSGQMGWVAIARHGNRPARIPRRWPPDQLLPGGVNVGFFDGHCELTQLERLWQLEWHKDWQAPAKRPGL
jgi:prepilin-type processing-associated H-X9-DG protein